tara:strand:+ start:235 stop:606 length:372 start_codon:yes stop_codon:yes gene_type:complete
MIFKYPTTSPTTTLTFTNNPEAPYSREVIKHNTSVQMEDGSFYVYSRSVTNYRYTIIVVLNSESERDALETFYDSTVNGSEKQFKYTDPYNDEYTVRFEGQMKISEIFKGRMYRATFNLIQTV